MLMSRDGKCLALSLGDVTLIDDVIAFVKNITSPDMRRAMMPGEIPLIERWPSMATARRAADGACRGEMMRCRHLLDNARIHFVQLLIIAASV